MKIKKRLLFYAFPFILLIPIIIFAESSLTKHNTYINSVGMAFELIPAGSFEMGISETVKSPCKNNLPRHRITITRPFYIGKYEVTQEQWYAVMNKNPSKFKGKRNPVDRVSWLDVQEFIKELNEREKTHVYRLPTEAEWEYACRADTTTLYYFGDEVEQLPVYAWLHKNSDHRSHPVGQLEPNTWGLYDMLGNVWEWCQDAYDRDYYRDSPPLDPLGPALGNCRVLRGGSWISITPYRLRCCFRFFYTCSGRLPNVGFRLVRTIEKE